MPEQTTPPPPPKGDEEKASKYIKQLVELFYEDKVEVHHTDLAKFESNSMQDHYRIDLGEYQIEVSHSRQPNTLTDSYVMLFTNFKNLQEGGTQKVIMAYIHLSAQQFSSFKQAADAQLERKRKAEEEKRFQEAMRPIDQVLENIAVNREDQPEETVEQSEESPSFTPSF